MSDATRTTAETASGMESILRSNRSVVLGAMPLYPDREALIRQNRELERQLSNAHRSHDEILSDRDTLAGRLEDQRAATVNANAEREALRAMNAKLERLNMTLIGESERKHNLLAERADIIAAKNQALAFYGGRLEARKWDFNELAKQLAEAQALLKVYEEQARADGSKIHGLEKANQALGKALDRTISERDAARAGSAGARAGIELQVSDLEESLAVVRGDRAMLQEKACRLEKEVCDLNNDREALKRENRRLSDVIHEARKWLKTAETIAGR